MAGGKQKNPAYGGGAESATDQDYLKVIRVFEAVLQKCASTMASPDRTLQTMVLLQRSSCFARLTDHESVVSDSKRALKLLAEMKDVRTTVCYVKRCLILALYKKQKLSQAEDIVREWLNQLYAMSEDRKQPIAILERYLVIFQLSSSGAGGGKRPQQTILDTEMQQLDDKLNNWIRDSMPGDQLTENALHPFRLTLDSSAKTQQLMEERALKEALERSSAPKPGEEKKQQQTEEARSKKQQRKNKEPEQFKCTYCALTFDTRGELTIHCQSESHQIVIMSDEGRDWACRAPPRGYSADTYSLCEAFTETGVCNFGGQCIEAHGLEELNEWKQRFEYRLMRLEKAREHELYGKSYTEKLLEKWVSASAPDQVIREDIESVQEIDCPPLSSVVSSKVSAQEWIFTLKSTTSLRAVCLLQDAFRSHFKLEDIKAGTNEPVHISNDQEWVKADASSENQTTSTHSIKVSFATTIYGTFRQSVVFDFGTEPLLVKHICVDVLPVSDLDKMAEIKKDLVTYTAKRWDDSNAEIIPFVSGSAIPQTESENADAKYEKQLINRYPCPSAQTLQLSQSTISEKRLTKNNYRNRMHELLYVEEIARYEHVARFNLTTKLKVTANYLLTPAGLASTSAKYSNDGELFALLQLRKDISEDTSAGRLILNNCSAVNLSLAEDPSKRGGDVKRTVYEAVIEDKGKNSIYLKLSPRTVTDLKLKSLMEISVDLQFTLNRLTFCEWHRAVDKVADYRLIFPDTLAPPSIPWTPNKQWMEVLDGAKLNAKQKEAVLAITSPSNVSLPPILLIGPFGTGKTFTLALAIKELLSQPEPRILICTHSNSAADLYIKEYLHPWVTKEGLEAARPLRVYYHKRWVATSHPTVQEYCLIDTTPCLRTFRRPTVEDVVKHRIVVVTLSISQELAALHLPKGFFTHIILDEAAQAMESEAIMALGLAGESSKIVLAGDHMQMSPELFSEFAKERNMHMSLLERLYDHYPTDFPTKILLCENYRAHEAIIKYTSELFYDQKLVASGKQPRHEKFYPLSFFTARGEDVQDRNSTTFYNNAEVYEVVERVADLVAKWPKEWGPMTESSVGIMTPYADQVMRIRLELRKRKLGKINVERVLNVQGKQFRAVFLSTVRTRKTCPAQDKVTGAIELDYGFLSNSKLLNTAITRSQSLVAVVGDPVALCSIGRCRKVWERFIETCNENQSLFGITWSMLRAQLDGVELKKSYVLNPLAPEFVPRAEMLRRMMLSGDDYGMYYPGTESGLGGGGGGASSGGYGRTTSAPAQKGPMNGGGSNAIIRHGGPSVRPYMNIDDMLEMYHPGGPSNFQQPHPQQPNFNAANVKNNPLIRNVFVNPPAAMNYYPQGPPPPQFPGPNCAGYDQAFPPSMAINNNQPLPGRGPILQQHQSAGAAVKWGTVPPNINPQLTGTNAWQSPPAYPPQMGPQQQQKMMMQQQQQNPNMRSPTHNQMLGLNHQIGPQWPMIQNGVHRQSPMMGGMPDFISAPNQHKLGPMNMQITGPQMPIAQQPHGSMMPGMGHRNSNPMRAPPGMGPTTFPPQIGPNIMPGALPPNNMNDLGPEMLGHRIPQLQQMRMAAQQRMEPDLASLQERFMMMNAGVRQHVPNSQLPVKNGLNPSAIGPLLPPNKNIYEMAVESKDVQLKWFTRLVETHGWDAAYKFAEMMGQAQSVMAQEFLQRQQHQQQQMSKVQQQMMTQNTNRNSLQQVAMSSGASASSPNIRQMNPQFEPGFESLLCGQPIRKLFEEPIGDGATAALGDSNQNRMFDEGLFGPLPGPSSQLLGSINGVVGAMSEGGGNASVPLYRRQAGQSTNSSSSVSSMSSQSVANGWMGELSSSSNTNNTKAVDSLFNRMPGDYGTLFGDRAVAGGVGQKADTFIGDVDAAAMTYASVLQQTGSGRMDAPRTEHSREWFGGVGGSNNSGGPKAEEKKVPSLDLQVGHRNGFYNYFG